MNSPKSSLTEDNLDIFPIVLSMFLLVRLKPSYIPKFSLLASFFILETAMKKNLKLGFGR